MALFDEVKALKDAGKFSEFVRLGMVASTVNEYFLIAQRFYELEKKRKTRTKDIIVFEVSTEMGIGRTKVYKALRMMESE